MEPQALPLNCEGGDRWSKLVNCHNCASAAIALSLREPVQAHMTIVRQRSRTTPLTGPFLQAFTGGIYRPSSGPITLGKRLAPHQKSPIQAFITVVILSEGKGLFWLRTNQKSCPSI